VYDVTVTDNEAPTITCSAEISVDNDPGACGAVVDYDTTTSDNCDGETFSVEGMQSGSTFPVATTTNTLSVVDAAGNTGGMFVGVYLFRFRWSVASLLTSVMSHHSIVFFRCDCEG
jgi:hypothetical protein